MKNENVVKMWKFNIQKWISERNKMRKKVWKWVLITIVVIIVLYCVIAQWYYHFNEIIYQLYNGEKTLNAFIAFLLQKLEVHNTLIINLKVINAVQTVLFRMIAHQIFFCLLCSSTFISVIVVVFHLHSRQLFFIWNRSLSHVFRFL